MDVKPRRDGNVVVDLPMNFFQFQWSYNNKLYFCDKMVKQLATSLTVAKWFDRHWRSTIRLLSCIYKVYTKNKTREVITPCILHPQYTASVSSTTRYCKACIFPRPKYVYPLVVGYLYSKLGWISIEYNCIDVIIIWSNIELERKRF